MIDIDDEYDNWEIKQHARVSKKRIEIGRAHV